MLFLFSFINVHEYLLYTILSMFFLINLITKAPPQSYIDIDIYIYVFF